MTRAQAKAFAMRIKYASYVDAINLIQKELEIVKKPYSFEKPSAQI